jgi:hypothetical protein
MGYQGGGGANVSRHIIPLNVNFNYCIQIVLGSLDVDDSPTPIHYHDGKGIEDPVIRLLL